MKELESWMPIFESLGATDKDEIEKLHKYALQSLDLETKKMMRFQSVLEKFQRGQNLLPFGLRILKQLNGNFEVTDNPEGLHNIKFTILVDNTDELKTETNEDILFGKLKKYEDELIKDVVSYINKRKVLVYDMTVDMGLSLMKEDSKPCLQLISRFKPIE